MIRIRDRCAASTRYIGRFAPSPTGPLHAGSLAAALASWLDARAHGGRWLLRIEDVDTPRCVPGAAAHIAQQLAACGLRSDAPVLLQSTRGAAYDAALQELLRRRLAYACGCTRRELREVAHAAHAAQGSLARHAELVYPGTCRDGLHGKAARATRLLTLEQGRDVVIDWHDRRLGAQQQNVTRAVGDFVLARADGLWAYQLAVVADDAAQGVTHVVRGADLADNTPRQIWLQRALGLATPRYLHTPLVLASDGEKLSKQNGAKAVALDEPTQVMDALRSAAAVLDLPTFEMTRRDDWLDQAVMAWRERWLDAAAGTSQIGVDAMA